jgi:hypothetical protein
VPRLITEQKKAVYWGAREAGKSMRDASQIAGISLTSARNLEGRNPGGRSERRQPTTSRSTPTTPHGEPIPFDRLCPEALRAINDFPYFQRRYFGRKPMSWQEEAANDTVTWLESPDEEYVVCNAPPGVGKTLLFTHDIPAWLIVRNRAIRILLGAITGKLAARYTDRLRVTLERTLPQKGKIGEVMQGDAYDAIATLAHDFGRFKPLDSQLWTREAFIVAQINDEGIVEKEPTVQSYGFDSEYIGNRVDFANWDDLVNPRKQRSADSVEQLRTDWDDQAETRLEPHGLLMLTGQRLASNDLYRYALDKVIPSVVDEATGDIMESVPKYHHLCFPAHYEDRCAPEFHRRGAPSYPEGCLLAPERLPWRKLSGLKHNNLSYETVYQQKDVDPETVLVQKAWVYGDGDFIGCVDKERDRLGVPRTPDGKIAWQPPLFSVMAVDPSPTRYWGIQWWVYQPSTQYRHLMDLAKRVMKAPEFLEWNPETNTYSGLLEEWWRTSKEMGMPITHLIVEINAAQRFLVQYKFFNNWLALRGVQLVNHSTHRNKSDPEYGVWTVRENWRLGRIRLPYAPQGEGRLLSLKLIEEVTSYPNSNTTDLTMAHWFTEFQLPKLYREETAPSIQWRPGWMRRQYR